MLMACCVGGTSVSLGAGSGTLERNASLTAALGSTWRLGMLSLLLLEGAEDVFDAGFGVAEEHLGVVAVEQWVLDAGVAGGHGAFEHDDVLGFPNPQDGHPGDGASRVFGRGGVDGVV